MRRAMYSLVLLAFLAGMLTGCRRYSGLCDVCGDPDPCQPKSAFYAGLIASGCGSGCASGGCASGGCAGGGCANGACGGAAAAPATSAPIPASPLPAGTPAPQPTGKTPKL